MRNYTMTNKSSENMQEQIRQRITKALEITGWSPSRLALNAGLAASTLSRFLYQPVKHTISLKTLTKVEEAVRLHLEEQALAPKKTQQNLRYLLKVSQNCEVINSPIISLYIRGVVQAGEWLEAMEWHHDDWQKISLPRPTAHKSFFGLRVKGQSMNIEYPEGTILVCVSIHDHNSPLNEGDHVIVQRWKDNEVEATVKEYRKGDDGKIWLWPRSTDPEHQTPILIPENNYHDSTQFEGSKDIWVVAVVVADYRIRAPKPL